MKLKILIFINYYGKKSETFISDEIAFLSSQENLDLTILHYGKDIPSKNTVGINLAADFKKRWLRVLRKFDTTILRSLQYRNGLNGTLASLIPFFRKNQFDTIYCHFGTNGKLIAELKDLGVIPKETKLVVRFHGLDLNMKKYPKSFYNVLNNMDNIVLYGTKMAQDKLTTYGLIKQIVFLPVGIKTSNISDINNVDTSVPDNFFILAVGRFIELKGHEIAIDIMENLKSDNVFLNVIGDGERFLKIQQTVNRKALESKVNLLGKKSHQEVFLNLEKSHIYLYSGIYDAEGRCENQATSVLEAMAQGKVVISSALGGITDYLIENKTGFLCEPGNVKQFVEKLQWIIQNYTSAEMTKVRQNAILEVQKNYCQEKLNDQLLKLLIA
ncbi:glycosyltransferase [Kaistella sp.]|uniref:glycosyltransferase n=1 Tax=Kaistella sp. TaxID=2782235 RepID=UPI002F953F29